MKKLTLLFAMLFAFVSLKSFADITIYVSGSSSAYMWAWDGDNNNLFTESWPGKQFSKLSSTTVDETSYYYYTFSVDEVNVIFSDSDGQTSNISGITADAYFIYNGGSSYELVSGSTSNKDITIYVASSSPSSYYLYLYTDAGDYDASWPGTQLSKLSSTTVDGTTYYYKTATDVSSISYILNDGDGGSQTDNASTSDDIYLVYNGGTSCTIVSSGSSSDDDDDDSGTTTGEEYTANIYVSATYAEYNYIYAYNMTSSTTSTKPLGDWDDKPLINTGTETTIDGETYYLFTISGVVDLYIMFVDGYANQTESISIPSAGDYYFCYDGGTTYTEGKRSSSSDDDDDDDDDTTTGDEYTANIYVSATYAEYNYIYAYNMTSSTTSTKPLGDWDDKPLINTGTETTIDGVTYYLFTISGVVDLYIIFADGYGNQTESISIPSAGDYYFCYDGGTTYTEGKRSSSSDDDDDDDDDTTTGDEYTANIYVSATYAEYNYIYAYNMTSSTTSTYPLGEWDDKPLINTGTETTIDDETYYLFTISGVELYIIFADGYGNETESISIPSAGDYYFCYDGGTSYTEGKRNREEYTANIYIYAPYAEYNYIYAYGYVDGEQTEYFGEWDDKPLISSLDSTEIDEVTWYYTTLSGSGITLILVDGYANETESISITAAGDYYITYEGGTDYTISEEPNVVTVSSVAYYLAGEYSDDDWETLSAFEGEDGVYTLEFETFSGEFKVTTITTYSDESTSQAWYGYGESDDYYGLEIGEVYVLTTAGANMALGMSGDDVEYENVVFILATTDDGEITLSVEADEVVSGDDGDDDDDAEEYTANIYVSATYAEYNYIYAYNMTSSTTTTYPLGEWDDKPLINTGTETTIDGETYYLFTISGVELYIIFVDGYNNQTESISIPEAGDYYFCYDGGTSYTEGKRVTEPYTANIYIQSNCPSDGYIYAYGYVDGEQTEYLGEWPGTLINTLECVESNGSTWYMSSFTGYGITVILSEGDEQTDDISLSEAGDYYYTYSGGSEYVGISNLATDGRTVVNEKYYNLSGTQVAEPTNGTKAVYIVVRNYSDGTTAATKEIR